MWCKRTAPKGFPMTPFTVASNKLQRLQSQLLHHDPGMQVSMSNGELRVGVPLRANRPPDQQELRTYLLGLSRELGACLDDFLLVSDTREAMNLVGGLGDGPVTVDKLSRVLDAAQYRLHRIAQGQAAGLHTDPPQAKATGDEALQSPKPAQTTAVDSLKALVHDVETAWHQKRTGLGLISSHEVLATPPDEWGRGDLKVKSTPPVLGPTSVERFAKRRGMQSIVADLANLIGHEVLPNQPNRNHPLHVDLVDALQAFAELGRDGQPVSPAKFIDAARLVLKHVDRSRDKSLRRAPVDAMAKDLAGGYDKVRQTDLYKLLFETEYGDGNGAELALIKSLRASSGSLEGLFKRPAVQQVLTQAGVTPQEVLAVWAYSIEYEPLNRFCRTGASVVGAKETIDLLMSALPKLRAPVTSILYRGVGLKKMSSAVIKQLTTIGSVFIDPAPLSTSYDPESAYRDDLKIDVLPCESSCGSSIMPLAEFVREKEILFPPFTRFLVTDARKDSDGRWAHVTLVELTEK